MIQQLRIAAGEFSRMSFFLSSKACDNGKSKFLRSFGAALRLFAWFEFGARKKEMREAEWKRSGVPW
jgi:hypothetical protein